jgi:hypothetical protein
LKIYHTGVLEKATHCSRQRHNVDGIRLFHQQTAAMLKANAANAAKDKNSNDSSSGSGTAYTATEVPKLAPLTLRLGCDVSRQVAQRFSKLVNGTSILMFYYHT